MAIDLKKWAMSKATRNKPVTWDPDSGPDEPEDTTPPMGKIKSYTAKHGMQLVTGSQGPEREGRGWRVTTRVLIPDAALQSW